MSTLRDNEIVTANSFDTEADFNMVNHLLKKPRYKIPEHLRDKIITRAGRIIEQTEDDKTALAAANTVIAMDKLNIQLVQIAMPKKVERRDIEKMPQEELLEALREVRKKLPEVLPYEA